MSVAKGRTAKALLEQLAEEAYTKETGMLEARARNAGLCVIATVGDGNCQFRAVAYQLHHELDDALVDHASVRNQLVDFAHTHAERIMDVEGNLLWEVFWREEFLLTIKLFKRYLGKWRCHRGPQKLWGAEETLVLACAVFECDVLVTSSKGAGHDRRISAPALWGIESRGTLHLGHIDDAITPHYVSIRPLVGQPSSGDSGGSHDGSALLGAAGEKDQAPTAVASSGMGAIDEAAIRTAFETVMGHADILEVRGCVRRERVLHISGIPRANVTEAVLKAFIKKVTSHNPPSRPCPSLSLSLSLPLSLSLSLSLSLLGSRLTYRLSFSSAP